MNVLAFMSAGLFAILGILHLAYTLHDFGARPRYFRPMDHALLPALQNTHMNIARGGRDYWSSILGFNLSHSIGLLLFALLIVVATQHEIAWLKPLLMLVSGSFAVIAWRCCFRTPMLGALDRK